MKTNFFQKINYLIAAFVIFVMAACSPLIPVDEAPAIETTAAQEPVVIAAPEDTPMSEPLKQIASDWELEVIAQGLEVPWSVIFPSEDRILVSERAGTIREISQGVLDPEPVYIVEEIASRAEAGLMGLALHPDYAENGFVYTCYAAQQGVGMGDKVVRLIDNGESLSFDRVILEDLPAAMFHAGCRLKFGPDGMLYITTGDALQKGKAQDLDYFGGKILRLHDDGQIPIDNPFPGSPVYSYGHRNPQGITWDVEKGRMYSTEHGPSGNDGPPGGDEINLILPGGNYGWPLVSHDETFEGTIAPLIQFTPAEAPASALFYDQDTLPFFRGSLFFGALRGEGLVKVTFKETNGIPEIDQFEKIIDDVGRIRDVVAAPDGSIYFTTSNRDGRGDPLEGDDKIYRIYPVYDTR